MYQNRVSLRVIRRRETDRKTAGYAEMRGSERVGMMLREWGEARQTGVRLGKAQERVVSTQVDAGCRVRKQENRERKTKTMTQSKREKDRHGCSIRDVDTTTSVATLRELGLLRGVWVWKLIQGRAWGEWVGWRRFGLVAEAASSKL